ISFFFKRVNISYDGINDLCFEINFQFQALSIVASINSLLNTRFVFSERLSQSQGKLIKFRIISFEISKFGFSASDFQFQGLSFVCSINSVSKTIYLFEDKASQSQFLSSRDKITPLLITISVRLEINAKSILGSFDNKSIRYS